MSGVWKSPHSDRFGEARWLHSAHLLRSSFEFNGERNMRKLCRPTPGGRSQEQHCREARERERRNIASENKADSAGRDAQTLAHLNLGGVGGGLAHLASLR
eukprot:1814679-Amphidinium_carterae.2